MTRLSQLAGLLNRKCLKTRLSGQKVSTTTGGLGQQFSARADAGRGLWG